MNTKRIGRAGSVVAATMALLGAYTLVGSSEAGANLPDPVTFTYTGVLAEYTVPENVCAVQVTVWGAQGGTWGTVRGPAQDALPGGLGEKSEVTYSVTPGDEYRVGVGGHGTNTITGSAGGDGGWGFSRANGGSGGGGGGGGASVFYRLLPSGAVQTYVVGGGGGGTGGGGATFGSTGAAGAGGTGHPDGSAGSGLTGGNGGSTPAIHRSVVVVAAAVTTVAVVVASAPERVRPVVEDIAT